MSEPNGDSDIKPPRFREAFERLEADIRAVDENSLLTINLDVPSVVATLLGVCTRIRGFRDEIIKHLPTFDIERFDRLESYVLALGQAHANYCAATEPPASLMDLASKVTKRRAILLADINTLVARELLPENVLKGLKGGTGHKHFAFDVFALSQLYRHHWDRIAAYTAVRRAELDEAEREADALTTAVGRRGRSPTVLAQVVRDRQSAYTLAVKLYDQLRTIFAYLRYEQGDADVLLPSLYLGRVSSKQPSHRNGDKPGDATATANAAAPATASELMTPVQRVSTAVAMPATSDAGPFV